MEGSASLEEAGRLEKHRGTGGDGGEGKVKEGMHATLCPFTTRARRGGDTDGVENVPNEVQRRGWRLGERQPSSQR